MGWLALKIFDEKGRETTITELTEIGREEVSLMCLKMISDLEDINREEAEYD